VIFLEEDSTRKIYCPNCQKEYLLNSENFYFRWITVYDFKPAILATCRYCHQNYCRKNGKGEIFRFFTDPTAGLSITLHELAFTCENIGSLSLREIRKRLEDMRKFNEEISRKKISVSTLRIGLFRVAPMVDAYLITKCKPELVIDKELLMDDAPYTKKLYKLETVDKNPGFCKIEKKVEEVWCCRLVGATSQVPYGFGVSRNRWEASKRCVERAAAYLGLELLRGLKFKADAFPGHRKALLGVGVPPQNIRSIPKHIIKSELNLIEGVNSIINRLYVRKHIYSAEASIYTGMVIAVADLTFWRTRTFYDGRLKTTIADLLKIKNKPKNWHDLLLESYWNVMDSPLLFELYGRFRRKQKSQNTLPKFQY